MKSEIEQRLHAISKEQLIQLLRELAARHPLLLVEMVSLLDGLVTWQGQALPLQDSDDEVTEDWDFNGDEVVVHPFDWATGADQSAVGAINRPLQYALPGQVQYLPLQDSEAHYQRVEEYAARLRQQESPQALFQDLTELVEEAIAYIAQHDDNAALDLFALLFDERLGYLSPGQDSTEGVINHAPTRTPALTAIYDQVIDAAMYSLEALLSEASSNTTFDADAVTLSPLLTPQVRHRWLERLFALWLKRLDAHRMEEDLPEIMLDVAWNEDMLLLRSLAQNELNNKEPRGEHSNIVDFTRPYRIKALEKFLKELP